MQQNGLWAPRARQARVSEPDGQRGGNYLKRRNHELQRLTFCQQLEGRLPLGRSGLNEELFKKRTTLLDLSIVLQKA